jgi:hypothetical protein
MDTDFSLILRLLRSRGCGLRAQDERTSPPAPLPLRRARGKRSARDGVGVLRLLRPAGSGLHAQDERFWRVGRGLARIFADGLRRVSRGLASFDCCGRLAAAFALRMSGPSPPGPAPGGGLKVHRYGFGGLKALRYIVCARMSGSWRVSRCLGRGLRGGRGGFVCRGGGLGGLLARGGPCRTGG